MTKQQQVTTATKTFATKMYGHTKERLKKLVRDKAAAEDRDITELELVDKYVNRGLSIDERKLKSKHKQASI